MEWYLKVIRNNYANFYGRARRKEYWMFILINSIIVVILGIFSSTEKSVLVLIYQLGVFIPHIAVAVRRMHDVGKSGWFMCIPFYNFILLVTDSEGGENQYGPSPKK